MGWSEALKEAGEGYSSRAGKSYLSHGHGAAAGFAQGLAGVKEDGTHKLSSDMAGHIATGAMGAAGIGGAAAIAANAQNSPTGAGIGGIAMAGALGAAMFMKPGTAKEVFGPPLSPATLAKKAKLKSAEGRVVHSNVKKSINDYIDADNPSTQHPGALNIDGKVKHMTRSIGETGPKRAHRSNYGQRNVGANLGGSVGDGANTVS